MQVYIINALYLWPITVWTYVKYGRTKIPREVLQDEAEGHEDEPLLHLNGRMDHNEKNTSVGRRSDWSETATETRGGHHGHSTGHVEESSQHFHSMSADQPTFATITIAICHYGAGCVLGDIVGELLAQL